MKILINETQFKKLLNENNKSFNDKIFYHGRTNNRPYNSNYIYITDSIGYANGYSDGKTLYLFKIPFSEDKIFSMRNKKHREILKNNIDDNSYNAILNSLSYNEMDWTSLNYIMNDEFEEPEELLENLGFLGIKLNERPEVESIYIFNQNNLNFIKTIDTTEPKYQKVIRKYYEDFNKKYLNEIELSEGTNRGEVYHYTSRILKILTDNKINLSTNLGDDDDKFGNKFFYLSLSRTPSPNIGYGKYNNYRLVLDGDKLNQNFKSIPVDYWKGNWKGNGNNSNEYEYEDRIISNKPTIDNISKYIIRIEIVTDGKINEMFKKILVLAKQRNIPVYFYENKKDLRLKQNNINDKIENIPIDTINKEDFYKYDYTSQLIAILSIVLYEKGILDNDEILKKNFNKLTDLYKLPKLDLEVIKIYMKEMSDLKAFRKNIVTILKDQLDTYFRRGKGDEFRNWVKILTNEMKKYNLTSIDDLTNLKYENNNN